ncbi:MAG TPA: winged helix-turn-helix domain-containing protein [Methylomirabilota bacterium]|nr:winged helix-turn-helix domain-containing protein [Methylomirabilota bacterium]
MSDALASLLAEVERLRARLLALRSAPVSRRQTLESLDRSAEELQSAVEELRQALGALDLERRGYADLLDLAPVGHVVTDQAGVVIEANRAVGELLGRSAESLAGCRMADLVAPGCRRDLAHHTLRARRLAQGEVVWTLRRPDGEKRLAQFRYRGVVQAGRSGVQVHWLVQDLEGGMFESETIGAEDPALARRWLAIYGDLLSVTESSLHSLASSVAQLSPEARHHVEVTRMLPLEARIAGLRRRQQYWQRRHLQLVRLEIDQVSGWVSYGGRQTRMSQRERELLGFLLQRPGRFFTSAALLARAWHASYLSEEQLRSYVVRLRQKLRYLSVSCELVNRRGEGYALVFHEAGHGGFGGTSWSPAGAVLLGRGAAWGGR